MPAPPSHKDILREQRARLTQRAAESKEHCPADIIIALALVTLALDVDYLTENLHRVGEGV